MTTPCDPGGHRGPGCLLVSDTRINAADLKWRVMAQVSLGEVLSSPNARAYSAINSKRVDLLIVSRSGDPIAAIEYQGHGHCSTDERRFPTSEDARFECRHW